MSGPWMGINDSLPEAPQEPVSIVTGTVLCVWAENWLRGLGVDDPHARLTYQGGRMDLTVIDGYGTPGHSATVTLRGHESDVVCEAILMRAIDQLAVALINGGAGQ